MCQWLHWFKHSLSEAISWPLFYTRSRSTLIAFGERDRVKLWKESLNSDGNQFNLYQQNKQSPLISTEKLNPYIDY